MPGLKGDYGNADRNPIRRRFRPSDIILRGRSAQGSSDLFQLNGDGRRLWGDSTLPPTTIPDNGFRTPLTGFQNYPIELAQTDTTQTSQLLTLSLCKADQSMLISNVTVATGGTAAGATPSLIQAGLYTIAGGVATLAASTPHDATLLTATFTPYTKALSTPFAVVRGQDLYFGFLVVTAAAAPKLACRAGAVVNANGGMDGVFGTGFRLGCQIAGQATLPASFALSSSSVAGSNVVWALFT